MGENITSPGGVPEIPDAEPRTFEECLVDLREVVAANINEDNQIMIWSAQDFAFTLHESQEARLSGDPYVRHLLDVAIIALKDLGTEDADIVVASLLHDSVEDQSYQLAEQEMVEKYGTISSTDRAELEVEHFEEMREIALAKISEMFGDKVAKISEKLSNPNFTQMAEEELGSDVDGDKLQQRKHELYLSHVEEAVQDRNVFIIKLADFMDNFLGLVGLEDSEQRRKLIAKYSPVAGVFIARLRATKPEDVNFDPDQIISKIEESLEALS